MYSEKAEYDSLFMSNYLDVYVKDALKRVPGVGDVLIFGERKYSMRLWVDPDRLAARQLTAGDVVAALREQNVQVAAGSLGQSPAPAGQMYQLSVRAVGRLREPSEFENIILKSGVGGSLVRVRDIGRAELGAETYSAELRFQGVEAVGFGVSQLPTANALDVERAVSAEMERLSRSFPPGIKYQVAFNTTDVVEESINEVLKTLAEAIALVVLVIFVFLQTWRSTIIPAVTIPVSLIGAFAFTKLMGFSINTLTLFGIILATGIVVDDAIVVIENIERHIQEYGKSAKQAASDAMREVFGAVIATGLVLIAVFVPVAFFPGTTGRLYAQFSMTIAFAVALSVFNAVTLTPALAALLLERESHHKGRFFSFFEKIICGRHPDLRGRAAACGDRAVGGGPAVLRVSRADLLGFPLGAAGLRAGRGSGLFPGASAGAGRRLARVHRQRRASGREDHHGRSRRAGAVLGDGIQLQRRRAEPGADVRAAEAIRGSAGRRTFGADGARAAGGTAVRPARGDRGRILSAVNSWIEPVRRLRVPGAGSDRSGHRQARERHPGPGEGGEPVRRRPGPLQPVHRQRSAAAGHDRSAARAGAGTAAQRDHERDADPAGVAGTSTTSSSTTARIGSTCRPSSSSDRARRHCASSMPGRAAATWCRSSRWCRPRR